MKRMVGVDIGATEVRVAEVAGIDASGHAIVTRLGLSPIEEGAISAGRIHKPEQVALALQRALKAAGVPRRGFILGMGNPEVAMTQVELPTSVKKSEREAAIRMGGLEISPNVPLEDASVSTQNIKTEVIDGIPMVTLSVAAVLQAQVDLLRTVCKLAGCEPRAIDLSGAALLRALTRLTPGAAEVASVVDIGSSKVTVATRDGLYLRSLRTVPGGGIEVSRALMTVTGEGFEQTEARKFKMKVRSMQRETKLEPSYGFGEEVELSSAERSSKAADDALTSAVELLVESVAQSIEADSSSMGAPPQAIIICGGTARLKGIKEKIQQRLGVPVAVGKPWLRIERSKRNALYLINGEEDPVTVMNLAVAVGLALWKEPS